MKRIIIRSTIWTMIGLFSLAGCGQGEEQSQGMQSSDNVVVLDSVVIPDNGTVPSGTSPENGTDLGGAPISGSEVTSSGVSNAVSGVTSGGASTPNQAGTMDLQEEKMKAYQAALEKLYNEDTFPDGKQYGVPDDTYDKPNNCFAIYDVDSDGKDELIIQYTDTITAGMIEAIYDYDNVSGVFTEELLEFPALTFYDNGVIKAEWSHNQGKGGEFWPYTVYKYAQEADAYAEAGRADAWDKKLGEQDYNGNPFPKDIDSNGDGIVYYVMGGNYKQNTIVDLEEYNQWWDSMVEDGEEMNIPYQNLKEYAQKYAVCTSKSVWEVERFARKVKEQILLGDFQGLSKEIAYPITIDGITYQDEEAFLKADFAGNLKQEILAELEAESCEGMFANMQGIMLGNGCVWIGEVMNDDLTSQGLKVITLNGLTSADAAKQ